MYISLPQVGSSVRLYLVARWQSDAPAMYSLYWKLSPKPWSLLHGVGSHHLLSFEQPLGSGCLWAGGMHPKSKPGIELTSAAWESEVLTSEPSGKSFIHYVQFQGFVFSLNDMPILLLIPHFYSHCSCLLYFWYLVGFPLIFCPELPTHILGIYFSTSINLFD